MSKTKKPRLGGRKSGLQKAASLPRNRKFRPGIGTKAHGYAFVVKANDGEWRFVHHEYRTTLSASDGVQQVYDAITDELMEFWRKVVLEDAFDWESRSSIDPKSMRLVQINCVTEDVTERLFGDRSMMEDAIRTAALSRLTREEATALGLEKQYAMMLMQRGGTDDNALRKFGDKLIDQQVKYLKLVSDE